MKALKNILYIFGLIMLFGACNRKGCTDSNAINYSEKAKKNDGSCQYESYITFWQDQSNSEFYADKGDTELRFFVEDEFIGSIAVGDYLPSKPECGASVNEALSHTVLLGESSVRSLNWEMTNQDNLTRVFGNWKAEAGKCVLVKLF